MSKRRKLRLLPNINSLRLSRLKLIIVEKKQNL